MSGAARDGRARGNPVDYSDFYLQEDAAKPKKKRPVDDFSDEDMDEPVKLAKPKPVGGKKSSSSNNKKSKSDVVAKPSAKKKEAAKKSKKRTLDDSYSSSSSDADEAAAAAPRAKKQKQKPKEKPTLKQRTEKEDAPVAIKRKKKAAEANGDGLVTAAKVAPKKAAPPLPPRALNGSSDEGSEAAAFRKKYEALRDLRETESERLLQDAKALALEEKKTYERMVAKLKKEVSALSSRLQDNELKHETAVEKLQKENQLRLETLERKFGASNDDSHGHRRRIQELEAQLSDARRRSKPKGPRAGDETVQLAQATKLLEIYRVVTSTDIRLIETPEEADDGEDTAFTDVSCTTTDSITGKQFHFDLGVPGDDDDEIEYLPSETPSTDVKVPSYFQEEMSFTRSEMTKFMRTILDVVIRKKTAPDAKVRR